MFRDIFTNRLFIGALAIFIFCVGGSLLYMQHVNRQGAEDAAETEARVEQWDESQREKPTAEAPVVEQPAEIGHFHSDGTWHAEPHETPVKTPVAAPESDPLETFSEEELQGAKARMLESLPEKLELMRRNRDTIKRTYENVLKELKYHEERNAQRERNFFDTSRIKERLAKAKANLDRAEADINHLEKWGDEHANK